MSRWRSKPGKSSSETSFFPANSARLSFSVRSELLGYNRHSSLRSIPLCALLSYPRSATHLPASGFGWLRLRIASFSGAQSAPCGCCFFVLRCVLCSLFLLLRQLDNLTFSRAHVVTPRLVDLCGKIVGSLHEEGNCVPGNPDYQRKKRYHLSGHEVCTGI